jgi:hypothetical protein
LAWTAERRSVSLAVDNKREDTSTLIECEPCS